METIAGQIISSSISDFDSAQHLSIPDNRSHEIGDSNAYMMYAVEPQERRQHAGHGRAAAVAVVVAHWEARQHVFVQAHLSTHEPTNEVSQSAVTATATATATARATAADAATVGLVALIALIALLALIAWVAVAENDARRRRRAVVSVATEPIAEEVVRRQEVEVGGLSEAGGVLAVAGGGVGDIGVGVVGVERPQHRGQHHRIDHEERNDESFDGPPRWRASRSSSSSRRRLSCRCRRSSSSR